MSNPVREAFVIFSVNYAQYTPIQPSAGRSGRCSSQKSIPEPQMRPRQDGRMGQVPHLGLLPARLRSQAERRRQRQGSGHSADELHRPHQCPAGTQEGGHGRELTHRYGPRSNPGAFFIPEPKKLARNEKIVLYLWRYKHITHLFLLSGNDNPYRNIDDCLAMGHARETWRKIYGRDVVCL